MNQSAWLSCRQLSVLLRFAVRGAVVNLAAASSAPSASTLEQQFESELNAARTAAVE